MTLKEVYDYLAGRLPIEQIPLNWDSTGYTSDTFNRWVSNPNFSGWPAAWLGDLSTEEEVRVMMKILKAQPGNSLLDVACGYGRHAILLATQYGLKVTGVDVSSGLIATAKRLATERQIEIDYQAGHARNLSWSDKFHQVILVDNSFSLFSPEDAPVILQGIYRSLRPTGRLFLDLDNKAFNCRYGVSDTNWCTWSGGLTLQEIYFHQDSSVEVCRDLSFRADSDQVEEFIMFKRIYSQSDICDLLAGCGFRVTQIYGGWDLSPLEEISSKMQLVGVKE